MSIVPPPHSTKTSNNTINDDITQECRTFLRWVNVKLNQHNVQPINNLQTDLCDGIVLVELFEICSGRKIGDKFTKVNTKLRQHHIDRIALVLDCMRGENIEIFHGGGIDPNKIISGDIETILSVLWLLIWHYSIAATIFESHQISNSIDAYESKKYRFLQWLQMKIPKQTITNFTSDWRNGKAVAALINTIAPGLCADPNTWNDNNCLNNLTESMVLARDWLNVQMLISPDELINGHINERIVMTYLSQFITATLRSGAPLRAKRISNRISAYGPGIAPFGAVAQTPANFTVETAAAGKGSIGVNIRGPNGVVEKADVRFNHDDKLSYSVSYMPKMAGDYKIFVTFLGKDIPNSPFVVHVADNVGDISKIQLLGPGLQSEGNFCGKPTYFEIISEDTESGIPEVIVLDPAGHKTTVPVKMRQIDYNRWRCEYVSNLIGLHSVNVFFGGVPVKRSPFGVKIAPICDSRKIKIRGRGIQARGIRNGDDAVFFVHTTAAGVGTPEVKIVGPGGINQNVDIKHVKEDVYECHYYPAKEGRYVIMVRYGEFEVPKAPFEVIVGPRSQSSIVAYGPGLKGGVTGFAAAFVVEMNGETGALAFSVAGPSQAEIECHDNGDGSALVRYLPTVAGEYAIHILCDNEDINKSPFIAQIQPKSNLRPDLVRCYGPGIQPNGVILNCTTEFRVDLSKIKDGSNTAPLEVNILDTLGKELQYKIKSNANGVTTYSYVPQSSQPHVIEVNYGGVAAADSPYRIYVAAPPDVTKIRVYGDWFETKTKLGEKNSFHIDTTRLNDMTTIAELNVHLIHEESSTKIPLAISNENGIYTIELNVKRPGNYLTKIFYGGIAVPFTQTVYVPPLPEKNIPKSKAVVAATKPVTAAAPIAAATAEKVPTEQAATANALARTYPENVKVYGPAFSHTHLRAGEATFFNIDVSEAGHGIVAVCIFNMNGVPVDNVFVVNKGGGLYTVNFIPPNERSIIVSVKYGNQNVNSSPFLLRIITKDEEIAVEAVDAAQTEKEKEIEKEKETTPTTTNAKIDKTQAVRRSDISLMIEDRTNEYLNDPNKVHQNSNDKPKFRRVIFKDLPINCPVHELTGRLPSWIKEPS